MYGAYILYFLPYASHNCSPAGSEFIFCLKISKAFLPDINYMLVGGFDVLTRDNMAAFFEMYCTFLKKFTCAMFRFQRKIFAIDKNNF